MPSGECLLNKVRNPSVLKALLAKSLFREESRHHVKHGINREAVLLKLL